MLTEEHTAHPGMITYVDWYCRAAVTIAYLMELVVCPATIITLLLYL